jgi:hypothetical protein
MVRILRPDGVGRVRRHLVAERSVHDAMHVVPVAPEERKIEHLQPRRDAAPDRRARDHEVHEAFLQLLDDLAFLAERAAREDADGNLAAGRAIDGLAELIREDVKGRRAGIHRMRQAQDQRAPLTRSARGGQCGCADPRQKRATLHGRTVSGQRAKGRGQRRGKRKEGKGRVRGQR